MLPRYAVAAGAISMTMKALAVCIDTVYLMESLWIEDG